MKLQLAPPTKMNVNSAIGPPSKMYKTALSEKKKCIEQNSDTFHNKWTHLHHVPLFKFIKQFQTFNPKQ